jgi:MFS family permease
VLIRTSPRGLSYNVIFAYPHELPLVQALIGAFFAIGLITGPIIGGAFAQNEHATWRWVSLPNSNLEIEIREVLTGFLTGFLRCDTDDGAGHLLLVLLPVV